MHWIAPTEKDSVSATLETRLWNAADQFRANSGLKAQEYSSPVLGLIFLRFAEVRSSSGESVLDAGRAVQLCLGDPFVADAGQGLEQPVL